MSRKLALNSLSGMMLFATNVVVVFFMSPVLIHFLGNRDYGFWELMMGVVGYLGVLDLGIGTALLRYISVADGKNDLDDMQRTVSTAFYFFLAVGALASIIFYILGFAPWLIAGEDAADISRVEAVFMLLAVNVAFYFPLQVFTSTLMGLQCHFFINCVRIILTIIQAVIVYQLIRNYSEFGILILAYVSTVFVFIELVIFSSKLIILYNNNFLKLKYASWKKMKDMLSFSVKTMTLMVANRLQSFSVPIIISHVVGIEYVIFFVIANRLAIYAKNITHSISFPLMPHFGNIIGRNDDKNELLSSWINTTFVLQIVSLAVPVFFVFYGVPFIGLWLGEEYALGSKFVLYVLVFTLVADSLCSNSLGLLSAQDRHGKSAIIWLILGVISIPLGVGGAMLWGVVGAAIGTTLSSVVGNTVNLILACRGMNVSVFYVIENTASKVLPSLLVLIVCLSFLKNLYPVDGYVSIILHILIAAIVYSVALFFFTIPKSVKEYICNFILALAYRKYN